MKEIRFTLDDSPLWHSLYIDYELSDEIIDDIFFAYLITQELRRMGIQEPAKQLIVFDEKHKQIAKSKDISKTAKLKFSKQ